MVSFSFHNTTGDADHPEAYFAGIFAVAVRVLGLEASEIELSVNLVDESRMLELNHTYRQKDTPTDVLSFPLIDLDIPIGPDYSRATIELGDLFICLSVAQQKAVQHGKTLDDEMRFLAVHGFLHLLGYDHERSPADETLMFSLQDSILRELPKTL